MNAKLIPMLLAAVLLAPGAVAAAAGAGEPKVIAAELETPFVLLVGETGRVEPEGLEVTFRSASDDSGCLTPNDCSMVSFNGSIAMRLEEKTDLATIQSVGEKDGWVSVDFAGYEIRLGSVRREGKGPVQATFTVTKAAEEEKKEDEPER